MKTIEEKMNMVRHEPAKIDRGFFENLSENVGALSVELLAACKAYESDVAFRKKNLDAQAVAARESIGRMKTRKADLTARVMDAASRADLDTAAKLEAELDSVEKELSILERKVRLADSTKLKGDPLLFAAAKRCMNAMEESDNQRSAACKECYKLLKPVIEDQQTLLDELWSKGSRRWNLAGDYEYTRVRDHFYEEEKKNAEAESAARILKEQERQQHRNLETDHWIAGVQD